MNLRLLLTVATMAIIFSSCGKETNTEPAPTPASFTSYTIQTGAHYCDQSTLKPITVTNGIAFNVKFNSSAVYQTKDPANQEDINKLWGFSEGEDHQLNSARIGCVDCKQVLLDGLLPQQAVWRDKAAAFEPKQVHWMVEVGSERARALARKTLREVREGLGLHA